MSEAPVTNRWPRVASAAGLAIGLLLVFVGLAWPVIVPPRMVWSPAQAEELQRAADAFHAAREQSQPLESETDSSEGLSPRALAEMRYDRLKADLERAQQIRSTWGHWVVAAGFGLTVLGGLGYLATREG